MGVDIVEIGGFKLKEVQRVILTGFNSPPAQLNKVFVYLRGQKVKDKVQIGLSTYYYLKFLLWASILNTGEGEKSKFIEEIDKNNDPPTYGGVEIIKVSGLKDREVIVYEKVS